MSGVEERLTEAGLVLPASPPKPGGLYVPVRVLNGFAFVAAQFPFDASGAVFKTGRIGDEISTEEAVEAARLCALNTLAQMRDAVGFDAIVGLARFEVSMVTDEGWDAFPRVVDGASETFLKALGPERGAHSRALFGVERLPLGLPMEMTATFAVR